MHVVGKDGIGQDIHPEDGGDALKPFTDPFPTKLVVFPAYRVLASQKRTTYASLHAMYDTHFIRIKQFSTQWSRHLVSPLALYSTQTTHLVKYVGGTYFCTYFLRIF
jgi:hypothetical protein